MGIRLLPASTSSPDYSGATEASTGLVTVTRNALATQPGSGSAIARPDDTYAWSSSAPGASRGNRIYGTPVEDSESQSAADGEYVSRWGSVLPIGRTAVDRYLVYARSTVGNSHLLDVYA